MKRYLIAGLGNPGRKYVDNRHNVGFRCVEQLAASHGFSFNKRQKKARLALGTVNDFSLILVKPRTFMNKSGQAVAPLVQFYKVPLERLLLIYDDLDLPLGAIRLRPSGGSGGHRGVRSVIRQLGSREFVRLRIGIGRPPGRMDPADYVLQDFSASEEEVLIQVLDLALDVIETWLVEGIETAMSQYNSRVIER